jgi:hypothetical protein
MYEIPAIRAWGSDGRSLGLDAEVDIVLGGSVYTKGEAFTDKMTCQCKVRKRLPNYIFPKTDKVDCHLIKQDRGETFIVLRYNDYLSDMKRLREAIERGDDNE